MNEENTTIMPPEKQIVQDDRDARAEELESAFSYDGYQVVRKELFAHLRDPAIVIRKDSITFNTACITGLEDVVYVHVMFNNDLKRIVVRGCDENDKDALRWCVAKPDKRKSRKMSCKPFATLVYQKMGWDSECRYKMLGYRITFEGETLYVFDLLVPEIFHEGQRRKKNVELLLNSVDRCIAIRPCEKDNPNAIRWGRLKEGRWCASTLGCRGLAKALFDMMEWEEGLKYRFRGQLVEQNDDKLMLFELDEPEMVKVEEIVLPSKEQDEEGKTVKQTIYIFPPEWAGTFGKPITSIAQVGILQQEHYSGSWDVLRPAAEIEEMNTFTADGLNALLHEAEKIMEGWTDTDE